MSNVTRPKPVLNRSRANAPFAAENPDRLVTVTGAITPDFIPEQERFHNPTSEPGEIQLVIDRDGEPFAQAFHRIGLVFSLRFSEIPQWQLALREQGFEWSIGEMLPILSGDGYNAADYTQRNASAINNILTSNESLRTLIHKAFNEPRKVAKNG
jgi:hypothetical protein